MADIHSTVSLQITDGIAEIQLSAPSVNKVDAALVAGLSSVLDQLAGEEVQGILLTSAHRDFCVGADLEMLAGEVSTVDLFALCTDLNRVLRRLETGPPTVALLQGNALGGGYELALACHHRLAHARARVGLPEVSLGVIPGGGGTQRLPRLIGLQKAADVILRGSVLKADKALRTGLIDGVHADGESLREAAIAWIRANPSARQPWDAKGFRWPGLRPGGGDARNFFLAASAGVYQKTAGAFEAPKVALNVLQEGSAVVFERSLEIEARAFARLATSDQARAMIRTLFFHKGAADKHVGLPRVEDDRFRKVAILGAGMMGAALAHVTAEAGYEVVLKDIGQDALDRGMAHIDGWLASARHLDDAKRAAVRARITPSLDDEALRGADLVIEAVFEDLDLKRRILATVEPLLAEGAVFASNTSALPIADIGAEAARPEQLIGLHFFSPVQKMPLVEIITTEHTSEDTLARCLHFSRAIRKTPIVVNDGYGFFTTRVFSAYILEGAQLVAEGYDPVVVDWAARSVGMVVGPLQVFDEVTLTLGVHALEEASRYLDRPELDGARLVRKLVEAGRTGRAGGAGFYAYEDGERVGIWSGLAELVGTRTEGTVEQLGERLLLAQVAEVGRTLDDGVLRELRDAELGAILGLGFAPNTGGPLSVADTLGLPVLVERLTALAEAHGDRYAPARRFRELAEQDARFF